MAIVGNIIKQGSRGEQVKTLQGLLNKNGFDLVEDGIFGKATTDAVLEFQKKNGLTIDGLIGPKTKAILKSLIKDGEYDSEDETEARRKLFKTLASDIGVPLEMLKAIAEVESRNDGFDSKGRPRILFERHWMHRRCVAKGIPTEHLIEWCPGIVNTEPGGYNGGSLEYSKLDIAKHIDNDSALESCSWGAFQIMGFHWKKLGFNSVVEFVNKQHESFEDQIEIFSRFIQSDKQLVEAMRNIDFHRVARIYNGSNYQANNYHTKLEKSFKGFGGVVK